VLIQVSTQITLFVEKIETAVLEWPAEVYGSIGGHGLYFVQKGVIIGSDNGNLNGCKQEEMEW